MSGDLFLIVYSVDSRESFDEARRLQEQVYRAKSGHPAAPGTSGCAAAAGGGPLAAVRQLHRHQPTTPFVPMVIVGNKSDREGDRVVDTGELRSLTDLYPGSCSGIETSALRNVNVEEVLAGCAVDSKCCKWR